MSWTTPRTWVTSEVPTAANMNTHIRDNVSALLWQYVLTDASETTTSATYVDLATVGPAVTVSTLGTAYVFVGAQITPTTATQGLMSYAVSSATTLAASDTWAKQHAKGVANDFETGGFMSFQAALTTGSNVFTAKYRSTTGGNSCTFVHRRIGVLAVGP